MIEALPARLRPLVTVALHTGIRRASFVPSVGRTWTDLVTGTIHVRQDKAGDGRWVTVNSVARDALLAVKCEQKILTGASEVFEILW